MRDEEQRQAAFRLEPEKQIKNLLLPVSYTHLDVYKRQDQKPLDIAAAALDYAKRHFFDVLIVDTAGRLSIDERMMQEASDLSAFLKPIETFFVVDAKMCIRDS